MDRNGLWIQTRARLVARVKTETIDLCIVAPTFRFGDGGMERLRRMINGQALA